jgi:hypothetical protein
MESFFEFLEGVLVLNAFFWPFYEFPFGIFLFLFGLDLILLVCLSEIANLNFFK